MHASYARRHVCELNKAMLLDSGWTADKMRCIKPSSVAEHHMPTNVFKALPNNCCHTSTLLAAAAAASCCVVAAAAASATPGLLTATFRLQAGSSPTFFSWTCGQRNNKQ